MVTLTKGDKELNLPKLLTDKADKELYDRCIKDGWVEPTKAEATKPEENKGTPQATLSLQKESSNKGK